MIQRYTFTNKRICELLNEYQKIYKSSPKEKRKRLDYKIWSYLRDEAKCGVRAEFDDWCFLFDIDNSKQICGLELDHPFVELLKENCGISSSLTKQKEEEKNMTLKNSVVDAWKMYDADNYTSLASCNCSNSTTANLTWYDTTTEGWGSDSINSICMNVDENNFHIGSKSIKEIIEEVIDNHDKNKKENETMKGFKFDFGPCTHDNIRMSAYGLAVKNSNDEWVSYNPASGQIINVDLLNFDGRKFMFKMPVAIKDVAIGDIVIHNRVPMFVVEVGEETSLVAVDPRAGEEKKILPTHSPFGFDYMTKVVSMFTAFADTPTPDAPFGNFLPFMFMGDDTDIDPMMLMFMMQQGNTQNMFSNPMMLYFLCGDKMKDNSMLPLMFMMNQSQPTKTQNGK